MIQYRNLPRKPSEGRRAGAPKFFKNFSSRNAIFGYFLDFSHLVSRQNTRIFVKNDPKSQGSWKLLGKPASFWHFQKEAKCKIFLLNARAK
jgi:hypothetical protein